MNHIMQPELWFVSYITRIYVFVLSGDLIFAVTGDSSHSLNLEQYWDMTVGWRSLYRSLRELKRREHGYTKRKVRENEEVEIERY